MWFDEILKSLQIWSMRGKSKAKPGQVDVYSPVLHMGSARSLQANNLSC